MEGAEGDTPIVLCNSSTHQISGMSIFLQVGITPLTEPRATRISTSSNYTEFRLRSLNRADFTDLDGPGDNGMPLVCAFHEQKSNVSMVSVFCTLV